MPEVRQAGPEARARLVKRSPRDAEREPIRQAIRDLRGDQTLELIPDEGETMRKLKTLASRAANEIGRAVKYGETRDGSLLVWPADAPNGRRRRSRRTGVQGDVAEDE